MPKRVGHRPFAESFDKKRIRDVDFAVINACLREGEGSLIVAEAAKYCRQLATCPDILSFKSLKDLDISRCESEKEFYLVRQLQALYSKRVNLAIEVDQAKEALVTFHRGEEVCHKMNKVLRNVDDPFYKERGSLLFQMSRKISTILGPCPSLEELPCGFGPGTNIGCSKNTSVRWKLDADATATVAAGRCFAPLAVNPHAWPGLNKPKAVRGSRFTTVPKNFLTDRGINVEPIINSYVQKGIGKVIRERLKMHGVDLQSQRLNQELAQYGSKFGDLATIDLSMASDTISYGLVLDLLPVEWFDLLDTFRSPECYLPDGKWHIVEKFSAMGNGYTFELESMIFYALLQVCVEGDKDAVISVYGDDLICPVEYYQTVLNALTLCGFIPNPDKSYGSGPFRESCGKDYWNGTDVRPCFIKEDWSTREIFRLHNFLLRTGRLPSLVHDLLKFIPKEDLRYGPDGFGDGHLIGDYVIRRDKRGWEPYVLIKTWAAKPRVIKNPLASDMGAALYLAERGRYDAFGAAEESNVSETMFQERAMGQIRYHLRTIRVPAVI